MQYGSSICVSGNSIFVVYTAAFRNSEFATTLFQVYFGYIPPGQGYIPNAYQYTLQQFQLPPKLTFYSIYRFYSSFILLQYIVTSPRGLLVT
jgi:hypothetical protein